MFGMAPIKKEGEEIEPDGESKGSDYTSRWIELNYTSDNNIDEIILELATIPMEIMIEEGIIKEDEIFDFLAAIANKFIPEGY